MAIGLAPSSNAVLWAVGAAHAGQASGATNAIRELGGVMGVAVLTSVFAAHGGPQDPQTFVDGLTAVLLIGAAVLAAGALAALLVPGRGRARSIDAAGEAAAAVAAASA